MPKFPGPAYQVFTRRLALRCWNPLDAPLLKEAVDASREHLKPWMPWAEGDPEELQVVVDRIRSWRAKFDLGEDFVYAIFDRDQTCVLGGTGLHTRLGPTTREIGYWIHVDHVKRGLASEAAAALTRVAFEIDGMQAVEIHCDVDNVASAAVPKKLGFTHAATLPVEPGDNPTGAGYEMRWRLEAGDYPNSPSARVDIEAFDAMGRRIL